MNGLKALKALKNEGYELFVPKDKLWDLSNVVAEEVKVDSVRLSKKFENQVSIVLEDEDGHDQFIPVPMGEIDANDYDVDKDGNLTDYKGTFDLVKAVALRDDAEFNITQGDETFRAIPA